MPAQVHHVRTAEEAKALAEHLLNSNRQSPVAVITIPQGRDTPYIDPKPVAEAAGSLADVYLMATGTVSWAFSEAMPPMTQVYGGAGRVYTVDDRWQSNPYASRLRFAYTEADGDRACEALTSDLLAAVGQSPRPVTPAERTQPVTAIVQGVVAPSRVIVSTDSGQATIWHELTCPGLPIERAFVKGMSLAGTLDVKERRVDVTSSLVSPSTACAGYRTGDIVLCRVESVTPETVTVVLFPGLLVSVLAEQVTGDSSDAISDLLAPGEVVRARVLETGTDGQAWGLSLVDVEDGEPAVPAPSVLPGGPPWLVLDAHPRAEGVPHDGAAGGAADNADAPLPVAPPTDPAERAARRSALQAAELTVLAAQAEAERWKAEGHQHQEAAHDLQSRLGESEMQRQQLTETVAELSDQLRHADRRIDTQAQKLRQAVTARRKAEKALRAAQGASSASADTYFSDPEQQLRHEVYLEWAERIPAQDKERLPLEEWALGADFIPSLERLQGVDRQKVVGVIVEIATGLVDQLNGRDAHRLRQSEAGGSSVVTRADGAVCWRAALQVNTPSARRIHYWRNGPLVELSRVTTHDDMTP